MIESPIIMPLVFPVTSHTDFVGQGSVFVAICGYTDNGINYIRQAIDKGAKSIIIADSARLDLELVSYIEQHDVVIIRVENTRKYLADLSAQAAGFPAKKLKIIGITGTKGKTTTAFLLAHILKTAGLKVGLLSSAGNHINETKFSASLTTPQPDYLQQFLKLCVDQCVEYVVMEVAAQALTLHRVKGIKFDGIIFTNFSHEHLEFYATLDDYAAAKQSIFDMAKTDAPLLINIDDELGIKIKKDFSHRNIIGYGFCTHKNIFKYYECPTLFGRYNEYNIIAATTMAHILKINTSIIIHAIETFSGVPGRLQQTVLPNGARAFIDYAHNPSSFDAVLSTLRRLTDMLIVVFGAGGGKDKMKRPIMGNIACKYADFVVLTSDNPRLENPENIINDICGGITKEDINKVAIVYDRTDAIKKAYAYSHSGAIIALLGKGPDEYQIIGSTKYYFSEQHILQQLL